VSDLNDIGCPTCNDLLEQEIFEDIDDILQVVPGAKFIDGDDGERASYLTMDSDGNPSKRYLLTGDVRRRIADRRPDGREGMVTPMVHLHDPKSGEFEELILSYTLGATDDVDILQNSTQYDARAIDNERLHRNIHEKPWLCKRLLIRPALRFYVKHKPQVHTDKAMSGLVPDMKHGVFQKGGWIDAFKGANQFR
jgi:hypothetical protein